MFGLSEKVVENLKTVFAENAKIDKAIVFGSRAKGNYKEGSDIDITIKGQNLDFDDTLSLLRKIDDLNIPYKIDLINYDNINEPDLKDHIDRVGIELFSRWKEYKLVDTPFGTIAEDWTYVSSLEFCSKITDGTHDSPKQQKEGKHLVTSKHIKGRNIDFETAYLISQKDFDSINLRSRVDQWDVIVSMIGEYCGFTYVERNESIDYAVKNVGLFKTGTEHKALWLYYYLNSKIGRHILEINKSGTSQPYLTLGFLRELPILYPPSIDEACQIIQILSSLDDKIDLLHRQNKTLEQLAETLFRQWFVEEAEESWKIGTLDDEFDLIMGQSPLGSELNEDGIGTIFYQGRSDFGFRFPTPRVYTTAPTRLAKQLDTLVSVRAPVGDMNIAFEECCLGRGVAAFRYKFNQAYYSYTYYKLRSLIDPIKQFEDNGSIFGSIGKDDFKKIENIIPPKILIEQFQKEAKPIDDKILLNETQIRTLTKTRDTLLPKLMSGEVRVNCETELLKKS